MEQSRKKAVAVIECHEEIPCNPCVNACPRHAIRISGGIHHIPVLDEDACIGCGICVAKCSGQAIFVVERDEKTARISFPYEMPKIPKKGLEVYGTDRNGDPVCPGRIMRILNQETFDRTMVVTIEVPAEFADDVRGFRYKEEI